MPLRSASFNLILRIAFLLSVIMMLWQFFFNRSLWNDEAMLALNIIDKPFSDLLKPLDNYQVAPVLFLWVEKIIVSIFGTSEMALRLFPFLCALSSLVLVYRLASVLFDEPVVAVTAMTLLGLSPSFIYFSSEVKQYACDMFVLLAIYYSAIMSLPQNSDRDVSAEKMNGITKRRVIILSVTGGVSVFLSNVSVIALFTAGLLLLYKAWRQRWLSVRLFIPMSVWVLCFMVNYFFFIHNHPYTSYMQHYWRDSFMPLQSLSEMFRVWVPRKISQIFHDLLPSGPWKHFYVVTMALYVFGLMQLFFKKKYVVLYLCVAPVMIHLLLSAAKVYPFDLRLTLYLEPLFLVAIAYGTWRGTALIFNGSPAQYVVVAALVFVISLSITLEFPMKREECRPVLEQMSREIKAGDSIYVYYNAQPVFRYYQETGHTKFNESNVVYGKTRTNDERHYLSDAEPLHGRVWFVFSHIYPRNTSEVMERNIIGQLRQDGTQAREIHGYGSSAYLFTLR